MFFVVSKIFWAVAQPFSFCLVLLVAGLMLLVLRRRKLSIAVLSFATLLLVLLGFTTLGVLMIRPLEDRFARPARLPADISAIIVLGGGFDGRVSGARQIEELMASGDRFVEALRLAQLYPKAKIVVSGGYGSLTPEGETDAIIAQRFFTGLGIGPDRLILEGQSRNTEENAEMTKSLLNPQAGDTLLLLTSAFHMPRSMGLFRAAGLTVIPWPADYRSTGTESFGLDLANQAGNLQTATTALREWMGLFAYKLTGKIEEILPSP
jgi:uncharacterized SAM-binding protein YcdF (DUF218 family)